MKEPSLPPGARRVVRLALRRPRIEQDVDAEVAFHLSMRAAELEAQGLPPDEARAEALRRFGNTHQWSEAMSAEDRERLVEERRAEWLGDLRQDLGYGVRSLLRAPLFSLLAVLTLALGIGANAAIFGVVKSVLLDALPYTEPDRLVQIFGRWHDGSNDRGPVSLGTRLALAERGRSFERLAAFEALAREAVFTGDGDPRVLKLLWAEPSLFQTLGVSAARGRLLRDDDTAPDTVRSVVLSYATWQRLYGGDPAAIGKIATINGIPREVVGVLPRDFISPVTDAEVFFPLSFRGMTRDPVGMHRRQFLGVIGRLKAGVTRDNAARDVTAISAALSREMPKEYGSVGAVAVPVRDAMVGDTRTPLIVLMASAGLVLLITCANLASALLSRTLSRRKEFAVRVALGAGRGRLVRQLLTESMVLAIAGGVTGLVLAIGGLAALRSLAAHALPKYAELTLDGGALAVTALIAFVTGLAFGVAPALAAGRSHPHATLRDEARGASESLKSRRLRGVLVASQIALCLSLLAGAALLARSLWAITSSPLGFNPDGVLTAIVQLPNASYRTEDARVRFFDQFEERVRSLPGVVAVASTGELPTRVMNRNGFFIEGAPMPPDDARQLARYTTVSPDYFRVVGLPIKSGHTFGPQDRAGSPPSIIISEGMAKRYWPNRDPVGTRVRLDADPGAEYFTVIGVVGDERNDPAKPDPEPAMYISNRLHVWNGPIFVIRTQGDPMTLVGGVRRELAAIDPALPLHNPTTLVSLISDGLAGRRLPVVLMMAFGGLALMLASVGVYAMFGAMAAAREREFGVRVALGSSRGAIATLVLRQGAVYMAAGLVGGALGVVGISRLLRGVLYGVASFDPIALGLAVLILIVSAMVALMVPVRRATKVDPITVLR
ncbi:MAG TPA: ABC transporter permease [Gemmatimonadaceae bacterium]|nr:ABC transporter permease [Gemmatimonadaceae bacterium]